MPGGLAALGRAVTMVITTAAHIFALPSAFASAPAVVLPALGLALAWLRQKSLVTLVASLQFQGSKSR